MARKNLQSAKIVLDPDGNPPSDEAPAMPVERADGSSALLQFRKLWNGGEHRRAIDAGNAAELSPEEWAVLHGEFPEILDVING